MKSQASVDMPAWMRHVAAVVQQIQDDPLVTVQPPPGSSPRPASVLLLFGEGVDGPELLLLERAADMRSHAGQVAFPGGSQDESDADAVAAALREAEEETGLDPAGVEIVGVLAPIWLAVTDFLVTPVIGWWHRKVSVHPVDPAETASVHVVPVAALLDPAHRGRTRHPSGYVGPAFDVAGVLVWGFTALILAELFRQLGWERPWDPETYFELPQPVRTPVSDEVERRTDAAGVSVEDGR